MFVSVAEELEREAPRRTLTIGEDAGWIRRTLAARSRFEEARWRRLFRQRLYGSRADVPLGVPQRTTMLPRARSGLPTLGSASIPQSQAQVPQQIISTQESGMFGDLAGGISDVFGNILEGINSTIEGVGSVVEDVAQAAGQVGAVRTQIEGGIQELGGTIRSLPDIFRGGSGSSTRGQDIATGAVLGEVLETGGELIEEAYDYLFGDDEVTPMEGELIPADQAAFMAQCGLRPENFYYGYDSAVNGYVLKKKRRSRRKMLATPSDLKQLAALKGVLGMGKAFETWIATRSC